MTPQQYAQAIVSRLEPLMGSWLISSADKAWIASQIKFWGNPSPGAAEAALADYVAPTAAESVPTVEQLESGAGIKELHRLLGGK